jgi:taurine dioxygenase
VECTVLDPVGVRVAGLSFATPSPAVVRQLQGLLAEHGVVILPDQDIDDEVFVDALRRFGELMFTAGEIAVPGFPDLNVVSNIGRSTPPRSTFHTDTSYVRYPPAYTALRAVNIPAQGGETLFTNQYRAFDRLPSAVRDELAGETITHVVTGLELRDDEEAHASHPIFRRHPISDRMSLYLSTPARCVAVSGMTLAQSKRTIAMLFELSTAPDNIYRHLWSPGDIVVWDNRCVLHCADHSTTLGDRLLHRGLVAGPSAAR